MAAAASRGGRGSGQGAEGAPEEPFEQWPDDIDFGPLAGLIGYALRRAQIAIYRDLFATIGEFGFTPQLFAALVLVDRNPALNQTDLGRVMGVNRAAAMALVNRLESLELVEREASKADKRANTVRLTRRGRGRLATLVEKVQAHDRRVSKNLNPGDLATLRDLLRRF